MRSLLIALLFATRVAAQCPTEWGYHATNGPERWGQMHAEWAECDAGKMQAPLDLAAMRVSLVLPPLAFAYPAMPVTVQNTGHDVRTLPLGTAMAKIGSEQVTLVQFHFHVPSEHALNGRFYDAELHFVHRDATGALHVVGVFIEEGTNANPALQALLNAVPATCTSVKLDSFSAALLLPASTTNYATYTGSLTIPPCTQPVTFYMLQMPVAATEAQIDALEVSGHSNARPLQPRGDRVITANFTLPD